MHSGLIGTKIHEYNIGLIKTLFGFDQGHSGAKLVQFKPNTVCVQDLLLWVSVFYENYTSY